jgi:FkbM family methyltransferase
MPRFGIQCHVQVHTESLCPPAYPPTVSATRGRNMLKIIKRRLVLWLHSLLKGQDFVVHGVKVTLPRTVSEELRYLLLRNGPYEDGEVALCRKMLSSGINVLELGGSLGVVSAVVRSIIGSEAVHVVVEANNKLADVCLENASRSAVPGKTVLINAAIDYSGVDFVHFEEGGSSFDGRVSAHSKGVPIPTITASECEGHFGGMPFALVCDIEGAEKDLVCHDRDFLSNCRSIVMEMHPTMYEAGQRDLDAVLSTLEHCGFQITDQVGDVFLFTREDNKQS